MAPRKKKPTKAASRKKPAPSPPKAVEEITEEAASAEPPEPDRPAPERQHKKFGKFRCLLEEPKPESDDSNPQEIAKVETEETVAVNPVENDAPDALLETESQMECAEAKNEEAELSEQLTQLNVVEGYPSIIEGDGEVYIDNVEADITVECVSEEIVADSDEQNVEGVEEEAEEPKNEGEAEKPEEPEEAAAVIEKQQKKPKKKPPAKSKKAPKGVPTKVKAIKTQLALEAQNSNSDASSASESSIRRSSRIKSINVLKQRAKGHGLAKKPLDSDTSENSNSSHVESSEKISSTLAEAQMPSPQIEADTKPVKVKSRWRRSSELEMSIASPCVRRGSPQNVPEAPAAAVEKAKKGAEEEVVSRLKQFVHLKENQYLTERISCKEAKKMTCDCFLTAEEMERGERGCGEDCLNRLLMIEW